MRGVIVLDKATLQGEPVSLREGEGVYRRRVSFADAFAAPPDVDVWITGLVPFGHGFPLYDAVAVDRAGFTFELRSNEGLAVLAARFNWRAEEQDIGMRMMTRPEYELAIAPPKGIG